MNKMNSIMEKELKKIHDIRRESFYGFVYLNEIESVRKRLRLSGVQFRTKPKVQRGEIIGYRIYIIE